MSEGPSLRRRELLFKLNELGEKYPNLKTTEIPDSINDDELEIIYLKKFIEVEDRIQFRNSLEKLADTLGKIIPPKEEPNKSVSRMIEDYISSTIKSLGSDSQPSLSKPDFVVQHHHIIRFEK